MVGGAVIEINQLASPAALHPVWSALEERSEAPFFLSWNWIATWLEATGAYPHVVTARRDGAVVALALVQESRRRRFGVIPTRVASLHETGDAGMDSIYIEYNGALRARGESEAVFGAMLQALTAKTRSWDELRLSAVTARAAESAAATGWIVEQRAASRCFAVDLAALRAAGGAYVDSLGANTRQQLRRTRRLYEARGPLVLAAAQSLAEAKAFLAELKALHQHAWRRRGQAGAFATPFFEHFHDRLLERLWPQGRVELLKIAAGTRVIGYLYNFIHRGSVLNYQSGFAAGDDNKLKPGLLSHALCVERHLAGTATRYDLMAGEARYKQNLAAPHDSLVWLTLRRPTVLARAEQAARRLKRALARHPNSLA
jgi:CelD/BcsL family acetyltransferase involved in cellulose biosynthesis